MNNLTHYQNRIYDKLLPKLGNNEPYEELLRLCLLYRQIKDIKKDHFLFEKFKAIINNSLYFNLKSKEEFYDLDRFKDTYETLVKEFIEDYFKTLWSRFKSVSKLLEQDQTLYSFRHSGAIEIFKRTGSITKLQKAMGHSSINVSLTYLRGLEIAELKEEDMPMAYIQY